MKKILLMLLIATSVFAQSNLLKMEKPKYARGSATDLDGSTEFMSKTSPVNLDLNGTERITTQTDRDFETSIGNWAVLGDASNKIGRSSVDKHAGTYSMVDTTSGAGSTANCVNLPYANFTALGTDANSIYEKYTLELWARGTGIITGGELITNGNMESGSPPTSWGNDNCSLSTSTERTGGSGSQSLRATKTANYWSVRQNISITSNNYYVSFWARSSINLSSSVRIENVGGTSISNQPTFSTTTDWQQFTVILATTETSARIRFSELTGIIANGTTFDLDDVSMKLLTRPSIVLACGNQTKTIANISCVPGTFTKLVWNFQATANEINQPIKIYANQADIVYIDDVSLTKKWDMLINVFVLTTSSTNLSTILQLGTVTSGYGLRLATGGYLTGIVFESVYAQNFNTVATINDGSYKLLSATINAIGNLTLYINGIVSGTPLTLLSIGSVIGSSAIISIGARGSPDRYLSGQIGEVQIVRFTDVGASNVSTTTLLSAYKLGIPKTWTNGTVVAHYKFRGSTDGQMLNDISGTGNSLSGTNTSVADIVRGGYPSR